MTGGDGQQADGLRVQGPLPPGRHSRRRVLALGSVAGLATALGLRAAPPARAQEAEPGPARTTGAAVDVRTHGAVGDGVADDAPAVAAAIAAAGPGGVVTFPPGVFAVATRIELATGVTLAGAGMEATRLLALPGVAAGVVVGLRALAVSDAALRDLTVDAAGLDGLNGVQVAAGARIVLERVGVRGAALGIWLNATSDSRIDRCRVTGAGRSGIEVSGARADIEQTTVDGTGDAGIVLVGAPDGRINGCRIDRAGAGGPLTHGIALLAGSDRCTVEGTTIRPTAGMGIYADASAGLALTANLVDCAGSTLECIGITPTCPGSVIASNRALDGRDNGISCSAPASVVTGNRVAGAAFMGIQVNGDDCTVSGNVVSGSGRIGGELPWAGIDLNRVSGCVVTGNRCFDDAPSRTQKYGVVSRRGADGNLVAANHLRGNALAALALSGPRDVAADNIGDEPAPEPGPEPRPGPGSGPASPAGQARAPSSRSGAPGAPRDGGGGGASPAS